MLQAPRDVGEDGSFQLQKFIRLHLPVEPSGKPRCEERGKAKMVRSLDECVL